MLVERRDWLAAPSERPRRWISVSPLLGGVRYLDRLEQGAGTMGSSRQ